MPDTTEKKEFTARYTASMTFSEASVKTLCRTQYNSFRWRKKLFRFIVALMFIGCGLFLISSQVLGICMIAVGCFMITGSNLQPNQMARQVLKEFGGRFPVVHYWFGPEGICFNEKGEKPSPYSGIIRLVEDKEYLYVYVSELSAHMIDASTVKGKDGRDGLKKYLSGKCGLEWTVPLSGINITLGNIKKVLASEERADKSSFKGDRLPYNHR